MSELVEFLRARLDEEQLWAKQHRWFEADVDAKRRIIDDYELAYDRRRAHPDDLASAGALLVLHGVCKTLALPYASHAEYRQEWKP